MTTEPKTMDIKEFREAGFLLEANRQFFHPLGLALAVEHNPETDEWRLCCIYDSRDDPEGWVMNEITEHDIERARKIGDLADSKVAARRALSPHISVAGIQKLVPHVIPSDDEDAP